MTEVMLRLGEFRFGVATAAYQRLRQTWRFDWQSQARQGSNPARHYAGYAREQILAGTMYPGQFGSRRHVQRLAEMAGEGKPLLLVSSTGEALGYWTVDALDADGSIFFGNGEPRKIDFSVTLVFYGDSYGGV